ARIFPRVWPWPHPNSDARQCRRALLWLLTTLALAYNVAELNGRTHLWPVAGRQILRGREASLACHASRGALAGGSSPRSRETEGRYRSVASWRPEARWCVEGEALHSLRNQAQGVGSKAHQPLLRRFGGMTANRRSDRRAARSTDVSRAVHLCTHGPGAKWTPGRAWPFAARAWRLRGWLGSAAIPRSLRGGRAHLPGCVGAGVYELLGFLSAPPGENVRTRRLPLLGGLERVPCYPEAHGFRLTRDRGSP